MNYITQNIGISTSCFAKTVVNQILKMNKPYDASLFIEIFCSFTDRIGARYIEINLEPPYLSYDVFDLKVLKNVKKVLAKYDIVPLAHAPYQDINLISLNSKIRKTSIQEIKKTIEIAGKLGIKLLTIHMGCLYKLGRLIPQTIQELAINSLKEICPFAKNIKLNCV